MKLNMIYREHLYFMTWYHYYKSAHKYKLSSPFLLHTLKVEELLKYLPTYSCLIKINTGRRVTKNILYKYLSQTNKELLIFPFGARFPENI